MIQLFSYALCLILIVSGFLGFRIKQADRRLAMSLVQILLCLLLLAGEYAFIDPELAPEVFPSILLSESLFGVVWLIMAHRLHSVTEITTHGGRLSLASKICIGMGLLGGGIYSVYSPPVLQMDGNTLLVPLYGAAYLCAFFLLLAVLAMAWHLESFWRALAPRHRWEYKFLMIGCYLVCGILGWSSSYQLTYSARLIHLFPVRAVLLMFAWMLIFYATTRHRLLNRKIFVSRKVIYSFVAPSIFAAYLILLGLVSMAMRAFGWSLPYVLQWLTAIAGLVFVAALALSSDMRSRIKYFISTHFYVNKYEYRDEWLALSELLQGTFTEIEVIHALRQVLTDSLYTREIMIWLGDKERGFRLTTQTPERIENPYANSLGPHDPITHFLASHPYLYRKDEHPEAGWKSLPQDRRDFLNKLNLTLLVPLAIGNQMVGLVGLGPEFTGGKYGNDDFDLLKALGTQTASALVAVRMAEELAMEREQKAWNNLSAFVLHDIKNAAAMLSLVQQNAPAHIHDPEFQNDMLTTVDDALKRMGKVQERLAALKGEITPLWCDLDLCEFLRDLLLKLGKKLSPIAITIQCPKSLTIRTDPELLTRIFENLLINSMEAQEKDVKVAVNVQEDAGLDQAVIEIVDNGPGIPEDLLPEALFQPFTSSKSKGSGIGLWNVKQLITSLRGTITATNVVDGGAQFKITLPLRTGGKDIRTK